MPIGSKSGLWSNVFEKFGKVYIRADGSPIFKDGSAIFKILQKRVAILQPQLRQSQSKQTQGLPAATAIAADGGATIAMAPSAPASFGLLMGLPPSRARVKMKRIR
jgi:hypothetical protein